MGYRRPRKDAKISLASDLHQTLSNVKPGPLPEAMNTSDGWLHLTEESGIRSPIKPHASDYFDVGNYGSIGNSRPQLKVDTLDSLASSSCNADLGAGQQTLKPETMRNYYDDFTSVDWVRDFLNNVSQREELYSLRGLRGKIVRGVSYLQDWVLILSVALVCSLIAYVIDKAEELLVDLKRGYCTSNIFLNQHQCCRSFTCGAWKLWPEVFKASGNGMARLDFLIYTVLSIGLALLACQITLQTKTTNPLAKQANNKKFKTIYSAYGSGVPEVKTILSGFVIRKYLGTKTLIYKSTALVLAIASGMSLGKEGPYVHLATCVGNILSRQFQKFRNSGFERRMILSAAAAAGVSLAFGSPLGGVLFSLEEVSYFLPGNQLFKSFFCSIMAIVFLKILDPYDTGKAVLFEVKYESDWQTMELVLYVVIGAAGGIFGACFTRFVNFWGTWFRQKSFIKEKPFTEVFLVAILTALLTFQNPYTNISVAELLSNLASPCYSSGDFTGPSGLCPNNNNVLPSEFSRLLFALTVKVLLTSITFGIKVPAGIYVPSMVIGALFGRLFAMTFQYFGNKRPHLLIFKHICDHTGTDGVCLDLGIYAMISAGSFMAGITRMNITLAVIIFELTSSYNYVIPISLAIAVSNFVAQYIEPNSLYEDLIRKNDLPFLSNQKFHNFRDQQSSGLSAVLTEVSSSSNEAGIIDLADRAYVSSSDLRSMLTHLQNEGLVDGYLPILKDGKSIGLLPAPELELALDKLDYFLEEFKLERDFMIQLRDDFPTDRIGPRSLELHLENLAVEEELLIAGKLRNLTDFRNMVESIPIILDFHSSLTLVELVFTRLGSRSIAVSKDGQFYGLIHKKTFIDYCRGKDSL